MIDRGVAKAMLVVVLLVGLVGFQFLIHMWVYAANNSVRFWSWGTATTVLLMLAGAVAVVSLWRLLFPPRSDEGPESPGRHDDA